MRFYCTSKDTISIRNPEVPLMNLKVLLLQMSTSGFSILYHNFQYMHDHADFMNSLKMYVASCPRQHTTVLRVFLYWAFMSTISLHEAVFFVFKAFSQTIIQNVVQQIKVTFLIEKIFMERSTVRFFHFGVWIITQLFYCETTAKRPSLLFWHFSCNLPHKINFIKVISQSDEEGSTVSQKVKSECFNQNHCKFMEKSAQFYIWNCKNVTLRVAWFRFVFLTCTEKPSNGTFKKGTQIFWTQWWSFEPFWVN